MRKLQENQKIPTKKNLFSVSSGTFILAIAVLVLAFAIHDKETGMSYLEKYLIFAGISTMLTAYVIYNSSKTQDKMEELAFIAKQNESTTPTKVVDFEPMVHESSHQVEEKPRKTQKRPAFETASL